MSWTLRHKIIGLAVFSAVLAVAITLGGLIIERGRVGALIGEEIDALARGSIEQEVLGVVDLCDTANDLIQKQVMHSLDVLRETLSRRGGLSLGCHVQTWEAVNQVTKASRTLRLPELTVGGTALGQNRSFDTATPVVDEVARLTGDTVTLFQRVNAEGDMLRVATNVRKADGSRAIGTYIPARNTDGSPNPVVSRVLAGEVYRGRAFVVTDWYVTAYEPVRNARGEVIGMIYTGVVQSGVEPRAVITRKSVGGHGRVSVMEGRGEHAGRLAVLGRGGAEGNLLAQATEQRAEGLLAALRRAPQLEPRKVLFERHDWRDGPGAEPHRMITAVAYFAPWDWVVVATAPEAEYLTPRTKAESALGLLIAKASLGGLVVVLVVGLLAWLTGRVIAGPISRATVAAERVAAGDLAAAEAALQQVQTDEPLAAASTLAGRVFRVNSADETQQLGKAVHRMTRSLNSLVGQVKRASVQLISTSTQISANAREQEAMATEFRASTNDVVAATRQISVTAQALERTVDEVAGVTGEAATVAGEGKDDLDQVRASIDLLSRTSAAVAARLAAIHERAADIHQIVGTITKVADQTNLLSLNASIEAEKAGEYGAGFSVVAREIRRLADQTAVATLDIESMVDEMQTAVTAGVGEMGRFEQIVARSVEDTGRLAVRLDRIIARVEALAPELHTVKDGMHQQAQGAAQISDSMVQLDEAARHTADSALELNNAARNLNDAVRDLQGEIARFQLA